MMEVFAAHQQVITKTDRFYGYGAGALSLCAAAVCLRSFYLVVSDFYLSYSSMSVHLSYGKRGMHPLRRQKPVSSANPGPFGLQLTTKLYPSCRNGYGARSTRRRHRLLRQSMSTQQLMIVKWKILEISCNYRPMMKLDRYVIIILFSQR